MLKTSEQTLGKHPSSHRSKTTPAMRFVSPRGQAVASIDMGESGQLVWDYTHFGLPIVESSALGIVLDGIDIGLDARIEGFSHHTIDESYPWRGAHSHARDCCTLATVHLIHASSQTPFTIEMRIYDEGLALRYVLPEAPDSRIRHVGGESTEWTFPLGTTAWCQTNVTNYEGVYHARAAEDVDASAPIGPPLTLELPRDRGFAAVTEGGLFNYSGMALRHVGRGAYRAAFPGDPEGWTMLGAFATPWRILIAASDLNGLVNSDIIHNVCPPPAGELANAAWIRPGRALWSWWSWFNGSLPYELPCDFDRERHFIDMASRFGFEYTLLDAGWDVWSQDGKDAWELLREVVAYGRERGVGIWVWRDHRSILDQDARHRFLTELSDAGVAGVKVDFMDSESKAMIDFYTAMMKETAALRLMVNFHGSNKPAGQSRTWPNEVTREGIMGLEHNKGQGVTARHNATLPFTRLLAGHGDYTPTTLTPEMLKGTTAAHQLALPVVLLSPLTHYADHPDVYVREQVDVFLAAIPTCWDETYVCPSSRIGQRAVIARRAGHDWFIAAVNGDDRTELEIPLDFLEEGAYAADLALDVQGHPQTFRRAAKTLHAGETIHAVLEPGGGMLAWLRRCRNEGKDGLRPNPMKD